VAQQMALLLVTFSNFEGQFRTWKPAYLTHCGKIQRVLSTICSHMNLNTHVACKFSRLFKNKDFSSSEPATFPINMVISQKRCQIVVFIQEKDH